MDNIKPNNNPAANLISGNDSGTKTNNANVNQDQVTFTNFLQHANHPGVLFFTLLFKTASILSFLFLNVFLNNDALTFIIVVIFSAFDFWFVKNVSGRY